MKRRGFLDTLAGAVVAALGLPKFLEAAPAYDVTKFSVGEPITFPLEIVWEGVASISEGGYEARSVTGHHRSLEWRTRSDWSGG